MVLPLGLTLSVFIRVYLWLNLILIFGFDLIRVYLRLPAANLDQR